MPHKDSKGSDHTVAADPDNKAHFFCAVIYIPSWILTHLLSGNPKRGRKANSADPDQTPHNAESDQGLHCLLTAIFL